MSQAAVEIGTEIPPWTMAFVDPQRMKTMAAILRDPYEVHWDHEAIRPLGFDRVINQGPLNLSYATNMLMAWQGPSSIRRLNVRFTQPVFEGDHLVARGTVTAIDEVDGRQRAHCDIRLDRGDGVAEDVVMVGTAVVAIGGDIDDTSQ
ncbi:MaoC family dehydratase [Ilumatobacter nonamiensis]|uniref:MaoC family dehydratase n=1 Tax=Ilumatobacter nonamiensis TaxID=467093 RepID=UPI00034D357C|nr:MaoC family dehydratase [Ilumatobacter nonamiensis]